MTTPIDSNMLSVRETAPRMTPQPPTRAFGEILVRSGRAILQSAVTAAAYIPGGNLLTAAVRGAGIPGLSSGSTLSNTVGNSAEAPASGVPGLAGPAVGTGSSTGAGSPGTSATGGSEEDMLARGQEMSMRMLRLQEQMGEENRRYTALSNVLHARHEMAKNAIGNIR